jgi:hypothetical protein
MNIWKINDNPENPNNPHTLVIENETSRLVAHLGEIYQVDHLFIFPDPEYLGLMGISGVAMDHEADHPELENDQRLYIYAQRQWYIFWFSDHYTIQDLESKYEVKNE